MAGLPRIPSFPFCIELGMDEKLDSKTDALLFPCACKNVELKIRTSLSIFAKVLLHP